MAGEARSLRLHGTGRNFFQLKTGLSIICSKTARRMTDMADTCALSMALPIAGVSRPVADLQHPRSKSSETPAAGPFRLGRRAPSGYTPDADWAGSRPPFAPQGAAPGEMTIQAAFRFGVNRAFPGPEGSGPG